MATHALAGKLDVMMDRADLGIDGLLEVKLLDSGGFAAGYEGRDEFGCRVAIKVLKALDQAARRRFDREREAMANPGPDELLIKLERRP